MNLKQIIEDINHLELDSRKERLNQLLEISNYYISNNLDNSVIAYDILDCIDGMRQSRFIETSEELELINISLKIARAISDKLKILSYLKDLIYYTYYYPDKYDKKIIEKEINDIETSL